MNTENSNIQPQLRIWAGDWDLPSVDPDCLSVITYAKFKGAPLQLEPTIPSRSVTGTLPELQIEESIFTSPLNIFGILRREGYNADFNLNSIDHADTVAYIALVEEKLKPALLHNLWIDSGNYVNVMRKAYMKHFGFFRSYWDLPRLRNKIEHDLICRGSGTTEEQEVYYYQEARNCINLLSHRLGKNDFFFGSTATTFDAIVFGHLSVLLKAPLVTTELKNHLLACDNLCRYCDRISQQYFNEGSSSRSADRPAENNSQITKAQMKERRYQIFTIGAAILINIAYLLASGIFIPKSSRRESNLHETDDILD